MTSSVPRRKFTLSDLPQALGGGLALYERLPDSKPEQGMPRFAGPFASVAEAISWLVYLVEEFELIVKKGGPT